MVDPSLLGEREDGLEAPTPNLFGEDVEVYELSNPFSADTPTWPYAAENADITRARSHAHDRVLAQVITHTMHMSTHTDAPAHVEEGYPFIDEMPIGRYIGSGVVVSIPKEKWGVITPNDLENAEPEIREDDIVIINSGWHKHFGENAQYFNYAPGLYKEAAEWFVDKGVRTVGVDQPAMDHPLGTRLTWSQGKGDAPLAPWLVEEYREETGRDVREDFPYWEPCHRILYTNGIPGIENIGGEIDEVTGDRVTILSIPLMWEGGDASMVRVLALKDT